MNKLPKKVILVLLFCLIAGFLLMGPAGANPSAIPIRKEIENNNFSGIPLKGGVKIDHQEQIVNLNLRNSDIRQVLRMLATKAGMNVIIHESVAGILTLDLVEVDLNRAFEYIMLMNNLTYRKDGNTLIIADNDTASDIGLNISEIKSIKIKYTDAQKVAAFLNQNVFSVNRPNTSTSSIITTNPSTNEVLVFGSDDDIRLAREVIAYLDVKPQIRNYQINFADPIAMASKICWTIFKSDDGEESFTLEADQEEGSETELVCGDTSETEGESESDLLEDFNSPSYWVLADTGLNQVTIYGGTAEQLVMADEIIKNFDKREPQVYMEISIIELNEDGSRTLASTYTYERNSATWNFADGSTTLNFLQGSMFGVNKDFTADIKALITQDKGRVLANPRIVAANNTKSNIKISSEVVESRDVELDPDTNTIDTTVNIGDGDSIEFDILPKVTPNGYVILSLTGFTFNTIKGSVTDSDGDLIATLTNSRDVEAKRVRVKDGDTFVVGGLIQETETISHKKIPVLGDIPVIGTLFQNQGTDKTRSELIIMITPRIIRDVDEIEPV